MYKIGNKIKTLIKSSKPYSNDDIFIGKDNNIKYKMKIIQVIKQEKNGKYWDNHIEVEIIKKVK